MEPSPPSYNQAVTNPHVYTPPSIDLDEDSEELGSSVDADEIHGAENAQFDEDSETNALLESEDATQRQIRSHGGESHYRTIDSSDSSGEAQLRASGIPDVSESLTQTTGSQYNNSGSGTPLQTTESQNRHIGSSNGSRITSHTGESDHRTTGSSSGVLPQIAESNLRTSSRDTPTSLQATEIQSAPSPPPPDLSTSSAQNQPPPPSYDEAFMQPGQARNNMQISRSALTGAHRDPLLDPEQPPPSYSAVVSSQGSRYYPPVNTRISNSSYATQPSTSGAEINRYPAERTNRSRRHGSSNYQGYQRMPHGSYIPVIRNTNEQSGLTAPTIAIYNSYHSARPTTSTRAPGNVQGYNTTPLAYVDPNSMPQEKSNTCGKLCTICLCIGLIFIPLVFYLMVLKRMR